MVIVVSPTLSRNMQKGVNLRMSYKLDFPVYETSRQRMGCLILFPQGVASKSHPGRCICITKPVCLITRSVKFGIELLLSDT